MAARKKKLKIPVEAGPPPPAPALYSLHRAEGRKILSVSEARYQLEWIERLYPFFTAREIEALAMRPTHEGGIAISATRARKVYAKIKAAWEMEGASPNVDQERKRQIARVMGSLNQCRGRRDPQDPTKWIEKPDHRAIARYEEILMRLNGTAKPLKVDLQVNYTEAMAQTFSGYSLEHLQELHERATRNRQLAERYVEENPGAAITLAPEHYTAE